MNRIDDILGGGPIRRLLETDGREPALPVGADTDRLSGFEPLLSRRGKWQDAGYRHVTFVSVELAGQPHIRRRGSYIRVAVFNPSQSTGNIAEVRYWLGTIRDDGRFKYDKDSSTEANPFRPDSSRAALGELFERLTVLGGGWSFGFALTSLRYWTVSDYRSIHREVLADRYTEELPGVGNEYRYILRPIGAKQ